MASPPLSHTHQTIRDKCRTPSVTAALSRHYCNASFPITGFLWTRFCEHNGTKSPREIQGRGSFSWPSPVGEATGKDCKEHGDSCGDTAATQPEGHPWGSRGMTIEQKRLCMSRSVNCAPQPLQSVSAGVSRCHCRQFQGNPRAEGSHRRHCSAWKKLVCKAIWAGGGALYLATRNFNQGLQLYVSITAGIFLKATGRRKQSKHHEYILKNKPVLHVTLKHKCWD